MGGGRGPLAPPHAILSQLGSKDATDTALLRCVLEQNLTGSLHGHEFFVRKAVGWALRQYGRNDPDWVRLFVAENSGRMSGLSRREASSTCGDRDPGGMTRLTPP